MAWDNKITKDWRGVYHAEQKRGTRKVLPVLGNEICLSTIIDAQNAEQEKAMSSPCRRKSTSRGFAPAEK